MFKQVSNRDKVAIATTMLCFIIFGILYPQLRLLINAIISGKGVSAVIESGWFVIVGAGLASGYLAWYILRKRKDNDDIIALDEALKPLLDEVKGLRQDLKNIGTINKQNIKTTKTK